MLHTLIPLSLLFFVSAAARHAVEQGILIEYHRGSHVVHHAADVAETAALAANDA